MSVRLLQRLLPSFALLAACALGAPASAQLLSEPAAGLSGGAPAGSSTVTTPHVRAELVAKLAADRYLCFKHADLAERAAMLEVWRRRRGQMICVADGSCPLRWCSWRGQRELRHGRADQSAKGRPTMGSSVTGAMVSRVM